MISKKSSRTVLPIKNGIKSRLENRACDPDILRRFRETNLGRLAADVFGRTLGFLVLSNPYPADLNRIRKLCSCVLHDFVITFYHIFPEGVKIVV